MSSAIVARVRYQPALGCVFLPSALLASALNSTTASAVAKGQSPSEPFESLPWNVVRPKTILINLKGRESEPPMFISDAYAADDLTAAPRQSKMRSFELNAPAKPGELMMRIGNTAVAIQTQLRYKFTTAAWFLITAGAAGESAAPSANATLSTCCKSSIRF